MIRFAKFALPLAAFAFAAPHTVAAQVAQPEVSRFAGKALYGPKGERIGAIYKVSSSGVPQLIINGKIVSVPASSLSIAEGKLSTSLDKKQLVKGTR